MSSVERRLAAVGLAIPAAPTALGAYAPGVLVNGLLYLSGQTPPLGDGIQPPEGLVGHDVSVDQAADAARSAILSSLAQAQAVLGDLDRVVRAVRLTGYIVAASGFGQHARVLDGASKVLHHAFAEQGRHARSAIGVASLPQGAVVELDLILQVSHDGQREGLHD